MLSRPLTILLVALAAAAPASAADPPSTAAATAPSTDAFLARLVPGNRFEIDSSKLAIAKSKSEMVKAFAKRMVRDHSDAATQLTHALTDARLAVPPDALDVRHQVLYAELEKKEGMAFDQAYVDAPVKGPRRDGGAGRGLCPGGRQRADQGIRQ